MNKGYWVKKRIKVNWALNFAESFLLSVKKEQQSEYKKIRIIFNDASGGVGFKCVQKELFKPFLLANPAGADLSEFET